MKEFRIFSVQTTEDDGKESKLEVWETGSQEGWEIRRGKDLAKKEYYGYERLMRLAYYSRINPKARIIIQNGTQYAAGLIANLESGIMWAFYGSLWDTKFGRRLPAWIKVRASEADEVISNLLNIK